MNRISALAVALALGFAAQAQAAMPVAPVEKSNAPVVLVYGGCGPFAHRGPYGGCRAGGQLGGYGFGRACPPGFHLGPQGARCWPN
jgi:hypothetical protein